jgi:3-phosphoshikimate 1-carboxyvinyltransferase
MAGRPIRPAAGALDAVLRAAPSKSVTHRALVAAALASGPSTILGPLDADDTRATREGLSGLGVDIRTVDGAWIVHGCGGAPPGGGELFLHESGTSLRFLLAVAALGAAPSTLDGAPRLRERPTRELAAVLEALGARVRLGPSPGGLPLRAGGRTPHGGSARVRGDRSSQFASALLLVAPRLAGGLELVLEPPVVSRPYLELTRRVLVDFGVRVEQRGPLRWHVAAGDPRGREYRVEGDHSSASYFLAAAAIVGGRMRMEGLRRDSAQPDARLAGILERLGCEVEGDAETLEVRGAGTVAPFDVELRDAPDLAPTLAVLGLFAAGPCAIRGIGHLRFKESDRLAVLAANLTRLGRPAMVDGEDLLIAAPAGALRGTSIATASDHRMAMAFAVAGLRVPGVEIDDPTCVSKSNPGFWRELERLEAG